MSDIMLEDNGMCFACGENNQSGLKLEFDYDNQSKTATTRFTPVEKYQGYKGIVHGGIIGLILDETMIKAAILSGLEVVTVEISCRFINTARTGSELSFKGTITDDSGKIIFASGEVKDIEGKIIATSKAKLFRLK